MVSIIHFGLALILLCNINGSIQQNNPNWKNSQLMRQFTNTINPSQHQQFNLDSFIPQESMSMAATAEDKSKVESKSYLYANGYPIIYSNPLPQPQVVLAPVPVPPPAPVAVPVVPLPAGPYPIQTPVVSAQGELIVESTIGGILFDCRGRPTGHWRDTRFCDIFHACVHGYQRKTYACPIVGERTYFDEITKKCEFISKNPLGCTVNVFLK